MAINLANYTNEYEYASTLHDAAVEIFRAMRSILKSGECHKTIRVNRSSLSFVIPDDEYVIDELTTSLYDVMDYYRNLPEVEDNIRLDMDDKNFDPLRVDRTYLYVRVDYR